MKLLVIDCCISVREKSRTKMLLNAFLGSWKENNPGYEMEVVDLKNMDIVPLNVEDIFEREKAMAAGNMDASVLALAKQFADADKVVIAAPLWEMSFPSKLRVYIEHISVAGITFNYTEHGNVGLCKGEKLLHIVTAGGPFAQADPGRGYLEQMADFYGIGHIEFLGADMQDVLEFDHETLLNNALKKAKTLGETF